MLPHNLERKDGLNYCTVCQQSWKGKPRKGCPGCKVIKNKTVAFNDYYQYKEDNYLKADNLRLLDKVCCYPEGKGYVYLYDPKGATEPFYPNLPPVLNPRGGSYYPSYAQIQEFFNPTLNCKLLLKSEVGLKSLNLKPTAPATHCYRNNVGDYTLLYNILDTQQLNPELPEIFADARELMYRHNYGAIAASKLRELNLQPPEPAIGAVGVVWIDRDWVYFWNIEDCKQLDPKLPLVYQNRGVLLEKFPQAVGDFELPKLNLQPNDSAIAVGAVWNYTNKDFNLYYLPEYLTIKDSDLPAIVKQIPPELYLESESKSIFNRCPGKDTPARACLWDYYNEKFKLLYDPADCPIYIEGLPQVYVKESRLPRLLPQSFSLVPVELKSKYIWSQINPIAQIKTNAEPKGCFLCGDPLKYAPVLLYAKEDLEIHDRDCYISKTKLKQIYKLPKSLINKLGKPDRSRDYEINDLTVTAHQYSRYRVEKFLADNAEAYAKHLSRYDRYLAIFETNKDKIAAGRARAKERRKLRQNSTVKKIVEQFDWDLKKEAIVEQCKKCLVCTSGMALPKGYLCAINPGGLDLDELPCPDWHQRSRSSP